MPQRITLLVGVFFAREKWLSWLPSTSAPKMDGFPLMLSTFSYVRGIRIGEMRKFFVLDASHEAVLATWSIRSKLSVDNGSTRSSRLTSTDQGRVIRFPACETHLLSSRLYCLFG